MQLFAPIYNKTLKLAQHPKALSWLAFISFIEAIFFPIPPDVMLMPMSMTQPKKAWRLAFITGIASTLGGIIGYAIGYFATDWVMQLMNDLGYQQQWQNLNLWFEKWGILMIFVAGFSPIPYKLFTIYAGVMQMLFLPFVAVAFISRTLRFILVAKLCAWGGEKFADKLQRYIEIIGWIVVVLAMIIIVIYK